jgi:hypothetical protein
MIGSAYDSIQKPALYDGRNILNGPALEKNQIYILVSRFMGYVGLYKERGRLKGLSLSISREKNTDYTITINSIQ